jgi:hypothetical protein
VTAEIDMKLSGFDDSIIDEHIPRIYSACRIALAPCPAINIKEPRSVIYSRSE